MGAWRHGWRHGWRQCWRFWLENFGGGNFQSVIWGLIWSEGRPTNDKNAGRESHGSDKTAPPTKKLLQASNPKHRRIA